MLVEHFHTAMQDIIKSQRGLTSFNPSFLDTLIHVWLEFKNIWHQDRRSWKKTTRQLSGAEGRQVSQHLKWTFSILPDELLQAEGEGP